MHRDVKLGLALGILIIGFAAAFCFPRMPAQEMAVVPVEAAPRVAVIDQQIQQLRVRSFVESEMLPAKSAASSQAAVEIQRDQETVRKSNLVLRHPSAPAPIPAVVAVSAAPELTSPLVPDRSTLPSATSPRADFLTDAAGPALYTVQIGDTLSGIAGKILGSSRRYGDLYAANTDVMANPDALVPGMVLKIPGRDPVPPVIAEEPPATLEGTILR